MNEQPSLSHIINHAMTYGTFMGIYWIGKFMLIPFIFSVPFTSLVFIGLTIAVPFIGYRFTQQYRKRSCPEQKITFSHAWTFCMAMYLFASLLVAVAHYIFFQYIDQGTLFGTYTTILDNLLEINPSLASGMEASTQALDLIKLMTPIELTLQMMINNLFYGMLMALPTALIIALVSKKEQVSY